MFLKKYFVELLNESIKYSEIKFHIQIFLCIRMSGTLLVIIIYKIKFKYYIIFELMKTYIKYQISFIFFDELLCEFYVKCCC